ncbi:hypothetical protein QOT17_024486 [Balamuthia mandrillaris]
MHQRPRGGLTNILPLCTNVPGVDLQTSYPCAPMSQRWARGHSTPMVPWLWVICKAPYVGRCDSLSRYAAVLPLGGLADILPPWCCSSGLYAKLHMLAGVTPYQGKAISYTISQYVLLCLYQQAAQSTMQDKTLSLAEIHNRISVLKLQTSTVLSQFLLLHQERILQQQEEKIRNLEVQLKKVEDILDKKQLCKREDHLCNVEKVRQADAATALEQWRKDGLLQMVDHEGVQCEAYIEELQSKGQNQKAKYPSKKVCRVNLPLHHIALIAAG